MIPGYGPLHFADTALTNVQLFGGRYPVVQTVAFTSASACLRVFGAVAGSVGGVSAAPSAAVRAAATDPDAAAAAEPRRAAGRVGLAGKAEPRAHRDPDARRERERQREQQHGQPPITPGRTDRETASEEPSG